MELTSDEFFERLLLSYSDYFDIIRDTSYKDLSVAAEASFHSFSETVNFRSLSLLWLISHFHCDTPPFLVASFPMITKKVRLVNRKLKTFRKPCKTPENPFFTLRVLLCDCEVFIEK